MDIRESLKLIMDDRVQVMEPDPNAVAECIKRAIGDTPLREFGAKAGLSASTLSRLINGKVLKPLDADTIIGILTASDLDEEEAEALCSKLATVNGMISKYEQQLLHEHVEIRKERERLHSVKKRLISKILLAKIAECGVRLISKDGDDNFDVGGGYIKNVSEDGIRYDYRLDVESEKEKYAWIIWAFPQLEDDYLDGSFNPRALSNRLMRELSTIFLTDAWKPDVYKDAKLTFCFIDESLFECFYHLLKDVKVNNRFSVILIDPKEMTVKEERILYSDKYPDCKSFFDLPPVMSITMDTDDVAEEITGNDFLVIEDNGEE